MRRWNIAIKNESFDLIRKKVVVVTVSDDFMAVLRSDTVSTNVYLRRLQNHCLDMGWLPVQILPKKKFRKIKHKETRAIKGDEDWPTFRKESAIFIFHANFRLTTHSYVCIN